MPDLFESGVFGNNTPAWHGKGRVVVGTFDLEEAMSLSGLNWTVEKRKLFIQKHGLDTGTMIQVPNRYAITRISDNSPLGVVGPDYQPIQNIDSFSALEGVLTDKTCRWETAISIKNGAVIAGVVSLPDSGVEILKGDLHYQYLLVINSHDGSSTLKVFPTDVRVVCANTVEAAVRGRDQKLTISIRHSGDVDKKVASMRGIIAKARADYAQFLNWEKQLTALPASKTKVEELFDVLFPRDEESKRTTTIRNNKIAGILESVHKEQLLLPQYTLTSGGPTVYQLFNGMTAWIDHDVGAKKDDRAEFAMLGGGNNFKNKAVQSIADVFNVPLPMATKGI